MVLDAHLAALDGDFILAAVPLGVAAYPFQRALWQAAVRLWHYTGAVWQFFSFLAAIFYRCI